MHQQLQRERREAEDARRSIFKVEPKKEELYDEAMLAAKRAASLARPVDHGQLTLDELWNQTRKEKEEFKSRQGPLAPEEFSGSGSREEQ